MNDAARNAVTPAPPVRGPDSAKAHKTPPAENTARPGELHQEHAIHLADLTLILFTAGAAAVFWFLGAPRTSLATVAGVICALLGGFPIYREAVENILERRMTMELSMAIAILAALAIREIFTALVITLFVLAAEVLEGLTVGRGRRSIQKLLDLLPDTAAVQRSGSWSDVRLREVSQGDIVLVKPGGRIPVDGSVVGGHSFVDQATITGESLPVEKLPGSRVFGGTINQSGALEIRVEKLGRDTTFGKIIQAVERAEQTRAPIQRVADRLAGYLVYFALGAAGLTFLITHNIRSTISVVIVAGACGIAAGTPLAILGAIGRAAHQGAIVKGGLYMEKLAEVDLVLFDKTGTVTFGAPEVLEIRPAHGIESSAVLEAALIAESRSEHPLARAVTEHARKLGVSAAEPGSFNYAPGKGVIAGYHGEEILVGNPLLLAERDVQLPPVDSSTAGAQVFVARRGRLLGWLVIADTVRPEARQAVEALKSMNLRTVLVTGDANSVAKDVGLKLGVDEIASELLPEHKLEYVVRLQEKSHIVAMVGDGVNDGPALMQASVGVAMGSGTDVARESADIVLIGNDLGKFVETVRIARRCRGIIRQNFIGTLLVDSLGMGLAAFGYLNPLLAAFIHVSSELTFILNSARLLPSDLSAARSWTQEPRSEVPAPRPAT
jgi:heavy metal translocating P-type ATPase